MADQLIAGRYTIQDELGRGASATVFKARDTLLDRSVALKVIASSLASDPEFTWRFEQEARLAARLDHPNIVTVHDVGTLPDGRAFIAMRLLEGKPLDRLMSERGQLPPNEVVSIVDQLASALDYTHAAGLVHRDVKPSNVTIDNAGRVTLTDFGIARALDSARVTLPGLTIGTPRYMSPEQVRGEDTTPATDEYSLAVMAYEMMAGRPPFEGDGTALMYKIVHEEPPAPNSFNPWLPESVAEVITKALSKSPEERWASSGEFARQLKDTLATSTGKSTALPGGHSGQTTIVSTPPTAVYNTGSGPAAPAATGSGPAGAPAPTQQAPVGTGSQPAAEPEQKKPTTIIPPVVLPESATAVAPADVPRTQVAPVAAPEPPAPAPVGAMPELEAEPAPVAAVSSQRAPAYGPPDDEPPPRKTALLWAGVAAVVVGAAALGAFLLMGGGDGEGRFDPDETPTNGAVASVDPRLNQTSSPTSQSRSPTVTTGPGTPTPTPQPEPTAVPVVVTVTNSQGTAVAATATPTNTTFVPPTNTNAPATRTPTPAPPATNTSIPPTATATNTVAVGFYAKIYDMALDGDRYVVYFDTNSWNTPGGDHVVFFFDGIAGGLPYYVNGVFKFTGYATYDKPGGSTQMCIVSADGSGRWRPGTGNCWTLPIP